MPVAGLSPIDSLCTGFESLQLKVNGWGSEVRFVSDIQIKVGGKVLMVQKILSSVADRENTFSETIFTVASPEVEGISVLIGTVSLKGKLTTRFSLECFNEPKAKLSPSAATLTGGTLSNDGRSIQIQLENFPEVRTSSDLKVQFGNIECDGEFCSVLSYQNLAKSVTVVVSVPPVPEVINIPLKVTFQGAVAPPVGGDPTKEYVRSARVARADFQYFVPSPKVIAAEFCSACNDGLVCLVNGECKDGAESKSASMTMLAKGRMTVVLDDVPQILFNKQTGVVLAPAEVLISFGDNFGVISRVLYSDETRSAFEVALESQVPKGTFTADLKVFPDVANPTSFSAKFPVRFFDDTVKIDCDGMAACEGQVEGGDAFLLTVTNYAITEAALENVLVKFDQLSALQVVSQDARAERSLLIVTPPAFDCSSCVTKNGFAKVELSLILRSTDEVIASSYYTFWAPPKFADCRFASVGTSLLLSFDQATNRGEMGEKKDCSLLIAQATVAQLGIGPECIWTADDKLTVALGLDPTIAPGDIVSLRGGGASKLTNINGLTTASEASRIIGAPDIVIPPYVELKAKDVIDPCSSLEMRATAFSPRPPRYSWSCQNNEVLNDYLSTQTSDTVYLPPGTASMPDMDYEYVVTLVVTDFMGGVSPTQYLTVFKKSAATPQIQFTPPFLSVTRNQEVEINGEAVFSDCPMDREKDMIFRWQQLVGPPIPTSFMMVAIPQLEIPADTLKPGTTYRFSLQASMTGAASQVMESVFELKTVYQSLVANIANGTRSRVSSFGPFTLSASGSSDPDFEGTSQDLDLQYSWKCHYILKGISNECRNSVTKTKLVLPATRDIVLAQGVLPAAPFAYMFEARVVKKGRSPVTKEVAVTIVDLRIPKLGIEYQGGILRADGAISLNLDDRLIMHGSCDDPKNMRFSWTISPVVNLSIPWVAPLGFQTPNFILQPDPAILVPGRQYVVSFTATTQLGDVAESCLSVLINSPPRGGKFSVCLLNLNDATSCLKTGLSVVDEFRILSSGWADDDVPLLYNYGYLTEPDPDTGNITEMWFDPVKDNVRDMGFPKGSLTVMAYVIDSLGGRTSILKDSITLANSDSPQASRRLLQAGGFFAKAKAMLKASLSAFRADKVNQMAGSMSSMGGGADMGGDIMGSLVAGSDRGASTNGRACEAMSSAAAVSSKPANVGAAAVGGMAAMLKSMLKAKLKAKVAKMSPACVGSAASATSGSMMAQAAAKKYPSRPPLLTPEQTADFVVSLESGMKEMMRKTALDFVPGEPAKKVSSQGSEHAISRAPVTSLNGAVLSHPLPKMFASTMMAKITVPDNFATEVFGDSEAPEVDIHVQTHGLAPNMPGWQLKSPMVGLTISRAQAVEEVKVQNISKPIIITIPVDLSDLNDIQRTLFSQQARCVYWDNNISTYNTTGCNVTFASLTSVTCECNHLTLFAVSVDTAAGACGDGAMQKDEQCDDGNVFNRDGCSSACVIEELCTCTGEPSFCSCTRKKGSGTPNADGVRATVALTGFENVDDWLFTELLFKESIAELVGNGVSKLDVVTIQVCYGADCEVFWDGVRRNMLAPEIQGIATTFPSDDNQSIARRNLLATTTDVKFQVNVPPEGGTTNADIYAAVIFPSFLSRLATSYGSKTGRTISATFKDMPGLVTEEEGEMWNKPGAGYKPGASGSLGKGPAAFLDSMREQAGLSIGAVVGVVVVCIVATTAIICFFVVIPGYKKQLDKIERAKLDGGHIAPKKRAIHPSVQFPGEISGQEEQERDTEVDEHDMMHKHSKRKPPRVYDLTREIGLEEHVHGNIGEKSGSEENSSGSDVDEKLPGSVSKNAKFGYAKQRLQELQDQLDAILSTIPDGGYEESMVPMEISSDVTVSDTTPSRPTGRLPPLIMGMGGGKAHAMTTSSSNFTAQHQLRRPTAGSSASPGVAGVTHKAALNAGWAIPVNQQQDEDLVRAASGRKIRLGGHAADALGLQPVPPPSRKPPTFIDAQAAPRRSFATTITATATTVADTATTVSVRGDPLLKDQD